MPRSSIASLREEMPAPSKREAPAGHAGAWHLLESRSHSRQCLTPAPAPGSAVSIERLAQSGQVAPESRRVMRGFWRATAVGSYAAWPVSTLKPAM
jgi:hypothetical protein